MTQNQNTVLWEALTDSIESVEDSIGHSDREPREGTFGGTDVGQNVEKISVQSAEFSGGQSDTEPSDGILGSTGSGHTAEKNSGLTAECRSGHSDTETTGGKSRGIDRQWRKCRIQQCAQ